MESENVREWEVSLVESHLSPKISIFLMALHQNPSKLIEISPFFHLLLLICLQHFPMSQCACNRTSHHLKHSHSALMATITFESANREPMFLRTIVGGKAESHIGANEQLDDQQEILHQVDSPEDELESKIGTALIGRLCMTVEPMRSAFMDDDDDESSTNGNAPTSRTATRPARSKALIEPKFYLECIPFAEEEEIAFGLANASLGIWELKQCPKGLLFDALRQTCSPTIGVNRSNCAVPMDGHHREKVEMPGLHFNGQQKEAAGGEQQLAGCYAQCQKAIALESAHEGEVCSWLGSALQADSESAGHFLQCERRRKMSGEPCGKWTRKQCPQGRVFNTALQLCVVRQQRRQNGSSLATAEEHCPQNSVQIGGRCAQETICPGRDSFCSSTAAHCCVPLLINGGTSNSELAHLVLPKVGTSSSVCSGGHFFLPIESCSPAGGCPDKFVCQPGLGCCPHWHQNWDGEVDDNSDEPDDYEQIGSLVCPGTENVMPEGSCLHCPLGRYCVPRLQGCCPLSVKIVSTSVEFGCPGGMPLGQRCAAGCADGFGCYRGFCCPMQCPAPLVPVSFCQPMLLPAMAVDSPCSAGGSCYQGICCQMPEAAHQQMALPVCPNGQSSRMACIGSAQCATGFECSNGGCCPIPYCPSGAQAVGRCYGRLACPVGAVCSDGLCCPLPLCSSTGSFALKFCGIAGDSCPLGSECLSGGCCPLPMCPGGSLAFGRCSSPGGCTSPWLSCFSGLCCPMAFDPADVPIVPVPFVHVPVPVAPVCSLSPGTVPMSLCGLNNACPLGHFCDGSGGCCPMPLPLCPFGGRALQPCAQGADCPAGFGCTAQGGCCRLPVQHSASQQCPFNQYPVCQCAAGLCPANSACHQGICCSSDVAVSFYQPGMRCRRSTDCQGSGAGFARCVRNICVCANGAYSNGAHCVRPPNQQQLLRRARVGCDEFGSPCRMHLIGQRRLPMFAPDMQQQTAEVGNRGFTGQQNGSSRTELMMDKPLWFNPLFSSNGPLERSCLEPAELKEEEMLELGRDRFEADSTCLLSEKCIRGKCKLRLWPGDRGCSDDLECQSRCAHTFCANQQQSSGNGTANSRELSHGRCLCRDGLLLFGKCFSQCPVGFSKINEECRPDNEEGFWSNSTFVSIIQRELDSKRSC